MRKENFQNLNSNLLNTVISWNHRIDLVRKVKSCESYKMCYQQQKTNKHKNVESLPTKCKQWGYNHKKVILT